MRHAAYVVVCTLSAVAMPWLLRQLAPTLSYALPVAINLALATLFAVTLRTGRVPMIERFARAERGTLGPDLAAYARTLTGVWVAFFVSAAALALALAAWGNLRAWLAFTSAGNYLAALALFVGEYWYRRWRFPQYAHASPRRMWSHVGAVLRGGRGR